MTRNRAAWIAGGVAVLVYLLALRNGWAGDDMVAVRDNPATKSAGAALRAWFEPYWPEGFRWAGLYRPFTILTYGVDWTISGGAPWVFHLTNVLLNALSVGLVVLVAAAWLPPLGALVAGLLFAVHPLHVEAVANTVGRAEILVAIGLLAAVLAARQYRRAATALRRRLWLATTLLAAAVAMASKEHGVIAIALIGLDHWLDSETGQSDSAPLYGAVLGLTLAWLFLWRGIAGVYVGGSGHAALVHLTTSERWATMLPTFLEVLRLLAWPFRLASDYSPQVIPVRTAFGVLALLGLASGAAFLGVGLVSMRRAPAVAFGILVAAVSYLPTSNVLFVSGVVLSERSLYLAVLAPALGFGWVVARTAPGKWGRVVWLAAAATVLAFGFQTVDRIPFWVDAQTPFAEEQTAHPENYQTRVVLARQLSALGDSSWALAELLVAGALLPSDPHAAELAAQQATAQGRHGLARREAERAWKLEPRDPVIAERFVESLVNVGRPDSAMRVAEKAVELMPGSPRVREIYAKTLTLTDAPAWRRLLAQAQQDWLEGNLVAASARLDSVEAEVPSMLPADACADARAAVSLARVLRPGVGAVLEGRLSASEACGQ